MAIDWSLEVVVDSVVVVDDGVVWSVFMVPGVVVVWRVVVVVVPVWALAERAPTVSSEARTNNFFITQKIELRENSLYQ